MFWYFLKVLTLQFLYVKFFLKYILFQRIVAIVSIRRWSFVQDSIELKYDTCLRRAEHRGSLSMSNPDLRGAETARSAEWRFFYCLTEPNILRWFDWIKSSQVFKKQLKLLWCHLGQVRVNFLIEFFFRRIRYGCSGGKYAGMGWVVASSCNIVIAFILSFCFFDKRK